MNIRKTVTLVEEINSEYGAGVSPPLRRVAIAAVFDRPDLPRLLLRSRADHDVRDSGGALLRYEELQLARARG